MREEDFFRRYETLLTLPVLRQMSRYRQHGSVTTFDHCLSVALLSLSIEQRLHLHADEYSLVRGALLHDFYLYDWHTGAGITRPRLHGLHHPGTALENARRYFALNPIEENIIIIHMWPLTLRTVPRCREAVIVCLADKICSVRETLFMRRGGFSEKD